MGFQSPPPIILSASLPGKSLKARSHAPSLRSPPCLAVCTPEGLVTPLPEFPQCFACVPLTALAKWYFRYFCLHSYRGSTWHQFILSSSAPICRVTERAPTTVPWRPWGHAQGGHSSLARPSHWYNLLVRLEHGRQGWSGNTVLWFLSPPMPACPTHSTEHAGNRGWGCRWAPSMSSQTEPFPTLARRPAAP